MRVFVCELCRIAILGSANGTETPQLNHVAFPFLPILAHCSFGARCVVRRPECFGRNKLYIARWLRRQQPASHSNTVFSEGN